MITYPPIRGIKSRHGAILFENFSISGFHFRYQKGTLTIHIDFTSDMMKGFKDILFEPWKGLRYFNIKDVA